MSKRKGTDYSTTIPTIVPSTVSVLYDDEWLETRQELKGMRSFSVDDLITSFSACMDLQHDLQQEQNAIIQQSQDIKSKLQDRIDMARQACQEESNVLYRMQLTLEQLEADRQALIQSLQDIDSLIVETKQRILEYKKVASQHVELMDQVEAERMCQVPRLKQQISLYATTTGIKWDFDEENVLAGQVVCIVYSVCVVVVAMILLY